MNNTNKPLLSLLSFLVILYLQLRKTEIEPHFGYNATVKMIINYDYPLEKHTVHTSDDYILTLYRIPSSPNYEDQELHFNETTQLQPKPVVFLQHGALCTSDVWFINGPEASLAYMLADAGYDVWLGNARGNTYSRQHKHIHPDTTDFWKFSWHEIGVYDLAAMIDYALLETNSSSLHFVAHSQGTTNFFVLMSSLPAYNEKLNTVHLMSPIAFMRNISSPLSKLVNVLSDSYSFWTWIFGHSEVMPFANMRNLLCDYMCSENSFFKFLCSGVINFLGGWGSTQMNQSVLVDACKLHPAGGSTTQFLHYSQIYKSADFRQYDHGKEQNEIIYQQPTPPSYNVSDITACVNLYYSDNDCLSTVEDVKYLASLLPCAHLYRMPYADWNHFDFVWSVNIKETINFEILHKMQTYDLKHNTSRSFNVG